MFVLIRLHQSLRLARISTFASPCFVNFMFRRNALIFSALLALLASYSLSFCFSAAISDVYIYGTIITTSFWFGGTKAVLDTLAKCATISCISLFLLFNSSYLCCSLDITSNCCASSCALLFSSWSNMALSLR
jgi:hypothetical protein